jgi:uncharacterized protein YqgC (DUF456 family)
MEAWAYYVWALVLIIGCTGAWATTLFTLPGNWLIAGFAALFALLLPAESTGGVTWAAVAVLVGLAVVGELIEFGASAAGAAKHGASKRGVVLSIVGAMVGSILGITAGLPIPIIGSFVMALVGGAAGAFFGAYIGESWKGRPEAERVAVGRGAFAGRIWGTAGKLAVGIIMLVIVAWDALF